jgi:hypothetical protein
MSHWNALMSCKHMQLRRAQERAGKRVRTHKEGVLGAGNEIATLDGTLDVGVLVDEVEEPVCVCMCLCVCACASA